MQHNTQQTELQPSTDQDGVKRDENGKILPGSRLNPSGRGGFQDRPEHRNKGGGWKRDETARCRLSEKQT